MQREKLKGKDSEKKRQSITRKRQLLKMIKFNKRRSKLQIMRLLSRIQKQRRFNLMITKTMGEISMRKPNTLLKIRQSKKNNNKTK